MRERGHGTLAPILVGAMLGSLVAGRAETAVACVAIAWLAAWRAGASWPSHGWLVSLACAGAFAWALNLYLTPGRTLGGWPSLFGRTATAEGLALGTLLALRVIGAFSALAGLRAAWPGEHAADWAARRLWPLRHLGVPVAEARVVTGLAIRFVPLLRAETARIARVQDLRAGVPPRGVREWWTRRRAAAVPAMVSTLERAERVALALEARHYRLRPVEDRPASAGSWSVPGAILGTALALVALLWRA
jgi:energy-coupling factor transporter transmembrane protein EcfT